MKVKNEEHDGMGSLSNTAGTLIILDYLNKAENKGDNKGCCFLWMTLFASGSMLSLWRLTVVVLVCLLSATCFAAQYSCRSGQFLDTLRTPRCVDQNGKFITKPFKDDNGNYDKQVKPGTQVYVHKQKTERSAEEQAILDGVNQQFKEITTAPIRKGKKISSPLKSVGGKQVPKYMQESCFLSDIDPVTGKRDPEAWGTTDHEYICCVKITRWQNDPYNVKSPENECGENL